MQTARLLASKFLTFLGEDIPKPLFKALVFGTRDNAPAIMRDFCDGEIRGDMHFKYLNSSYPPFYSNIHD